MEAGHLRRSAQPVIIRLLVGQRPNQKNHYISSQSTRAHKGALVGCWLLVTLPKCKRLESKSIISCDHFVYSVEITTAINLPEIHYQSRRGADRTRCRNQCLHPETDSCQRNKFAPVSTAASSFPQLPVTSGGKISFLKCCSTYPDLSRKISTEADELSSSLARALTRVLSPSFGLLAQRA